MKRKLTKEAKGAIVELLVHGATGSIEGIATGSIAAVGLLKIINTSSVIKRVGYAVLTTATTYVTCLALEEYFDEMLLEFDGEELIDKIESKIDEVTEEVEA